METAILKNVKLGQWNLEEVKTYIRNSAINEETCIRFSDHLLRTAASYLYGLLDSGLPEHASELKILLDVVFECHDVIQDAKLKKLLTNTLFVQRSLYHIMQFLVKWDVNLSLLGLQRLYNELKTETKDLGENSASNDWKVIVQNSYLLLWNAAIVVEKHNCDSEFHVTSLILRREALKYLVLSSPDIVKLCGQAAKAAKVYHAHLKSSYCPKLEEFFKEVYGLLHQQVEDRQTDKVMVNAADILKESFNFIVCWLDYMVEHSYIIEAEQLTKCFVTNIVKKLLQNISKISANSYLMCIDILLISLHFHPKTLQSQLRITSNLSELFKKCLNLDYNIDDFAECIVLSLSVLRKQIGAVLEILPKQLNIAEYLHLHLSNLQKLLRLYFLSGNFDNAKNAAASNNSVELHNLMTFCGQLLHICFWSLKHFSQIDEPNRLLNSTFILNTSTEIAQQYTTLIDKCDDPRKYVQFYVTVLGNLATVCFSNEWFEKVVYVLKPCVKYYRSKVLLTNEDDKTHVISKVELLIHCLRQLMQYKDALHIIAEMLAVGKISQKKLLVLWWKVKRDAKSHGSKYKSLIQITSKDLVTEFLSPEHKVDFIKLLKCEAQVYQSQSHDTSVECLAVYEALLHCCPNDISRAETLIEAAELQLDTLDKTILRSSKNKCQDAIKLLKSVQSKKIKISPPTIECLLAHSCLILHLFESQETEFYEEEVDVTVAQYEQHESEKRDSESCSPLPAYYHITVEMECESVHSLDFALNMWSSVINKNPKLIPNAVSALRDLKTMTEIYSLMRMVSNEVKTLKLTIDLAKAINNDVEYELAVAHLITLLSRQGLIKEAFNYLSSCKSKSTDVDFVSEERSYSNMSVLLAKCELLLMQSKIAGGWSCLKEVIMAFDKLKVSSVHFDLLWSEVQLLWSKFCEIPTQLLPRDFVYGDSPITLAVDSLRCCLQLLRKRSTYNLKWTKMELICFKKRLMVVLLDCTLRVGQLYHDIGAPREARCFLNEQLVWSQKLSLANRTAELLLVLAKIDIMCDSYVSCQIKLNGVAHMLESAYKKPDVLPEFDCVEQEELHDSGDDFIINSSMHSHSCLAKRSSGSLELSPVLTKISLVDILTKHSSCCLCIKCKHIVFHRLRFELVCLQAECLHVQNSSNKEALMAMAEILKQAESFCELEKSILVNLLDEKAKQRKGTRQKKQNCAEPFLQVNAGICRILCKMANLYLENNDLNNAYISIQKAYHTICILPWLGVGQIHSLLATIMYLYCIIKLAKSDNSQGFSSMGFLDRNWPLEKFKVDSTNYDDTEAITAKLKGVLLNNKPFDYCETPQTFQNLKAGISSTTAVECSFSSNSLCHAPVKKNLLLSFYENDFAHPNDDEYEKLCNSEYASYSSRSKGPLKQLKVIPPLYDKRNDELKDFSMQKKVDATNVKNEADLSLLSPLVSGKDSSIDQILLSRIMDNASVITRKIRSPSKENLRRKRNCQDELCSQTLKNQSAVMKNVQGVRLEQNHATMSLSDVLLQCPNFTTTNSTISKDINPDLCYSNPPMRMHQNDVKNIGRNIHPEIDGDMAEDFFRHMFEGSEFCRSKSSALEKQTRKTRSRRAASSLNEAITGCEDLSLSNAIGYLEKALALIHHHPPVPLYSNLNMLLALLKGECNSKVAYHLFEANAVTLRHQTISIIASKIGLLEKELSNKSAPESRNLLISKLCNRKLEFAFGSGRYDNWEKQLKEICDRLPADWTVCQINTLPNFISGYSTLYHKSDLIITRLQHATKPLVVKIPFEANAGVVDFIQEFEAILQASSQSVRLTDRKLWWETRYGLDQRLQTLLDSIENKWLGQWKGLLLGQPMNLDDQRKLKDATAKVADCLKSFGFNNINLELLEVLVDSIPSLQAGHLRKAMAALLNLSYRDSVLKEVCMAAQRSHQYHVGQRIARHPVILIVDQKLQQLPWENIPILRCHPSTRLPSIHFLLGHLMLYENNLTAIEQNSFLISINTSNAFYVLNPDSNLTQTEERFKSYFESLNWQGITAKRPSIDQWHDCLVNRDLFVYCGHGSGNHFLRSDALRKVDCKACALLIGCSSGKLNVQGRNLEPRGVVQQYLVAGCPSIVANLWDVTDKDIDRYLERLLNNWLPGASHEEHCLSRCVAISRQVCHLPYMIGASPVVYGLPVRARSVSK